MRSLFQRGNGISSSAAKRRNADKRRMAFEQLEDRQLLSATGFGLTWGGLDTDGAFVAAETKYTVSESFFNAELATLGTAGDTIVIDPTLRRELIADLQAGTGTSYSAFLSDFYSTAAWNDRFTVTVGSDTWDFYLAGEEFTDDIYVEIEKISRGFENSDIGKRLYWRNGSDYILSKYTMAQYWDGEESTSLNDFDAHLFVKTEDGETYTALLATRGTAGILDILDDVSPYGTGYNEYIYAKTQVGIMDWLDNPLQTMYGTYDNSGLVIAGHSLGGSLAQWIAADYDGYVDHLVTYNSTGIDRDLALNPDGSFGDVRHYVCVGDMVSLAGEAFIEGDVLLYDFVTPESYIIFDYMTDRHLTRFTDGSMAAKNATVTYISTEEFNSYWFHYDDAQFTARYDALTSYVLVRGTTELARSELHLGLLTVLWNALPDVDEYMEECIGVPVSVSTPAELLTSVIDIVEAVQAGTLSINMDVFLNDVFPILAYHLDQWAATRDYEINMSPILYGLLGYSWNVDNINQERTLAADGTLASTSFSLNWNGSDLVDFTGEAVYSGMGLGALLIDGYQQSQIWDNLYATEISMTTDVDARTWTDVSQSIALVGDARFEFGDAGAAIAEISISRFNADGTMTAADIGFNKPIGSVSNIDSFTIADGTITVVADFTFDFYRSGSIYTFTITDATILMRGDNGDIQITGDACYNGNWAEVSIDYDTDGSVSMWWNAFQYKLFESTSVWVRVVSYQTSAQKTRIRNFGDQSEEIFAFSPIDLELHEEPGLFLGYAADLNGEELELDFVEAQAAAAAGINTSLESDI